MGSHITFGGNTDPGFSQTTDPDIVLGSSPGLDVTMALDGGPCHPDLHGSSGSLSLRHQYKPGYQRRPQGIHMLLMTA